MSNKLIYAVHANLHTDSEMLVASFAGHYSVAGDRNAQAGVFMRHVENGAVDRMYKDASRRMPGVLAVDASELPGRTPEGNAAFLLASLGERMQGNDYGIVVVSKEVYDATVEMAALEEAVGAAAVALRMHSERADPQLPARLTVARRW